MDREVFFGTITTVFEVIGVSAMCVGLVVSAIVSVRSWIATRSGRTAFTALRNSIGLTILLGLEILVAADLVKTVTSSPSITDALVLAIIVAIRTVLSISLQIEIDGVAPWKRALLTTSPQLIARAAAQSKEAQGKQAPSKEESTS